jgi:subtilisin-like proprotein convertase family protein
MGMQAIGRWLGEPKKVALLLLAAGLAAVAALGVVASAASAAEFSNTSGITINDGGFCDDNEVPLAPGTATPYPSEIPVSGLVGSVTDVTVTVSGLNHTFPDDIGLLLVSPEGQNVILMTDSGGDAAVSSVNLTFDDAASGALPDTSQISSGTYLPSPGTDTFEGGDGCSTPASFPLDAPAGPYGSSLSVFNDSDPNGTWQLYVIDDTIDGTGSITSWSLDISAGTASDTQAPKVISTFPRGGGEVGPAANIRATFSEEMQSASVKNAFKLFKKGSTTKIAATVTYDAATDIATLNPTNNLRRDATYKAVVSTVAKDEAGNRLDQNGSKAGLQQKVWFFEID